MKHYLIKLLKRLLLSMEPPETVLHRMGSGTIDVAVYEGDESITEDNREIAFYQ